MLRQAAWNLWKKYSPSTLTACEDIRHIFKRAVTFRSYLTDGQGNVRYVTDHTGAITASFTYDPYGNVIDSTGSSTTIFGFQSQQQDVQSGLTYLRARYYDASTGRFTSVDPFPGFAEDPIGQNGYNYANNDPINLSDPTGLIAETGWDIANVAWDVAAIGNDIQNCNWGSLALNSVSLVYDTAATFVPLLPAGLTKVVKVEKIAEEAKHVSDLATKATTNLADKLAVEEALSKVGKKIKMELKDSRYSRGWDKFTSERTSLDGIVTDVHYMKNRVTGAIDQVKIKLKRLSK